MELKNDTFKIGPAGTNDKNAVAEVADRLGIANYVNGDYIIVGPMTGDDRIEIYEKAKTLSLGCVDYIAQEDPAAQVDLAPVLEALDQVLANQKNMAATMEQLLGRLSAAGKAMQ